jgi:hypothetical protein
MGMVALEKLLSFATSWNTSKEFRDPNKRLFLFILYNLRLFMHKKK